MDKDESKKKCPLTFNLIGVPSKLTRTAEMRMSSSFCIQSECQWWKENSCKIESIETGIEAMAISLSQIMFILQQQTKSYITEIEKIIKKSDDITNDKGELSK